MNRAGSRANCAEALQGFDPLPCSEPLMNLAQTEKKRKSSEK
jgi:hypothetical protein